MKKTLAVILNYNTPELTNRLYESLKPYEENYYDLVVLDNGSPVDGKSKYTAYELDQNVYYGGGLNAGFHLTLTNEQYDSLLFLNSDLIIHGYNFVKTLRKEMFDNNYKLLSPSIIQPQTEQCYWKCMHNWNSDVTRVVPWIDFQCPLIHIDLIKAIHQFDSKLNFGWGNDVYVGMVCKDNDWKIGVVDFCAAVHLNGYTIQKHNSDAIIKDYNKYAQFNMIEYFKHINRFDEFIEMRELSKNYQHFNK